MLLSELLCELQLARARYGDIEVIIKDHQSFDLTLTAIEEVDPKTAQLAGKMLVLDTAP